MELYDVLKGDILRNVVDSKEVKDYIEKVKEYNVQPTENPWCGIQEFVNRMKGETNAEETDITEDIYDKVVDVIEEKGLDIQCERTEPVLKKGGSDADLLPFEVLDPVELEMISQFMWMLRQVVPEDPKEVLELEIEYEGMTSTLMLIAMYTAISVDDNLYGHITLEVV